jgi:CRISPR-associated endonuclease/helicase Cas3
VSALGPDEFSAFFEAVHGYKPFPWQLRLAKEVVTTGKWPPLLDLPTSSGKTASIDIAVFHLACEADRGPERRAPLRILFVVDRRIVVDEASRRAKKIAETLSSIKQRKKHPVLAKIARRLAILSGDLNDPLAVVRLRGGAPQEVDWVRSPAQPLVAVSTVDQVGSRLLFRGYGVSPRMWPVHAGLVGSDALWLLDEVHLSRPLEETLDAIQAGHPSESGDCSIAERTRLAPFWMVKLSATPGEKPPGTFRLDGKDHADKLLKTRLAARKIASIATIEGEAADVFAEHALRLAGIAVNATPQKGRQREAVEAGPSAPVSRIAVVLNRVDLARRTFERVSQSLRDLEKDADVILVTGRIRPLDRDRILKKLEPLLASPERREPNKPIFVIATQCIEAGADLDFDALVTEIAPLDALRQRFGRLDRLGTRHFETFARILCPKRRPTKDNDWAAIARIYGDTAYETKLWLESLGEEVDFGINHFQATLDAVAREQIERMLAPRRHAPVLLPTYAELWTTTSPAPPATPEPALFLHGPGISPDVQIIWRADIDPEDMDAAATSLQLCPPSSLEALPVPIWVARRWLRHQSEEAETADVPERDPDERGEVDSRGRPCLRLTQSSNHDDRWRPSYAGGLRPGDLIAVPFSYGGCDEWGWNPASKNAVHDLGLEAHYLQRLRGAVRVTFATLADALSGEQESDSSTVSDVWRRVAGLVEDAGDEIDAELVRTILAAMEDLPNNWRTMLEGMSGRRLSVTFYDDDNRTRGFIIFAQKRLMPGLLGELEESTEDGEEAITDRDDSWATGVSVRLVDHLDHVKAKASTFAYCAGLDEPMTKLVALAAQFHDLGKADIRFQADLYEASILIRLGLEGVPFGPLLAKSRRTRGMGRRVRAAPAGFRHEALSVALAEEHPAVQSLSQPDQDLVLWLIGTHHGYGRPFFPPMVDPAPATRAEIEISSKTVSAEAREAPLKVDQGWFERAERVRRRFGPWELARLEAILRLADHAASADEEQAEEKDTRRHRTPTAAGVVT